MNDLIQSLKNARKKKGLTQLQLAQSGGLPQGHISSIESGKTDARLSTLVEMARVLEHELMLIPRQLIIPIKALINGEELAAFEQRWRPDEENES